MNNPYSIKTLRIALTEEGKENASLLPFDQIHLVAKAAVSYGVRRFDISGGEPLERADIPLLLMMLSSLAVLEDMTMTTNGVLLPRWAKSIRGAGVRSVAVRLDTFDPSKYRMLTGGADLTAVLSGIRALMEVGFPPATLEVRLIRGVNDDELPSLVNLTKLTGVSLRLMELTSQEAAALPRGTHMTCEEALALVPQLASCQDKPGVFRLPGASASVQAVSCGMRDAGCLLLSADGLLRLGDSSVSVCGLTEEEILSAVSALYRQA